MLLCPELLTPAGWGARLSSTEAAVKATARLVLRAVELDEWGERIGSILSEPPENRLQCKLLRAQLWREFSPFQRSRDSRLRNRTQDVRRNRVVTARVLHDVYVYFLLPFIIVSFYGGAVRELSNALPLPGGRASAAEAAE
jgi:hypothetical protein